MPNSFRKLPDGAWGVLCPNTQKPGDVVTVVTSAGKPRTVTLKEKRESGFYGDTWTLDDTKPATQSVGDLAGLLALFDRAKGKRAAIVIALGDGALVRINVAGERAAVPGSLTVVDGMRPEEGESRDWYGRVLRDGTYQPSRAANGRTDAIVAKLRDLAREPAKTAAASARLTGRCVFCNTRIGGDGDPSTWSESSRKSAAVGYGRDCAERWGLPWGDAQAFRAEG